MKLPASRYFNNEGYRSRSVVICFKDETFSQVLLMTSSQNETVKWKLPGGHIEHLELPRDAAKREMLEEAGVKGEIIKFIGKYENQNIKVINYIYACIVHSLEDQYDEAYLNRVRKWFTIPEALEYLNANKPVYSLWLKDTKDSL